MRKGIALVSLIITIVIMLILTAATFATSKIIEKARIQNLATNMMLIQAKVKIINERIAFNGDTSIYVGKKLKDQANKESIANGVLTSGELQSDSFYIYDRETLNTIGLEGIKLAKNEVFIVNYDTCEIIWPKGLTNTDGDIVYKLSEIVNGE